MGKQWKQWETLFWGAPFSPQMVTAAMKLKDASSLGENSSHVCIWELDHKKGWALKYWCFQIVVLEKILESSLDSKEIKPVHPKGNQLWIFIGRIDAEAPILWPPDAKNWLIWKLVKNPPAMWRPGFNPWVGKISWRRERLSLQYSDLENSMDCIVHGVEKSRTQLSNFHFTCKTGG